MFQFILLIVLLFISSSGSLRAMTWRGIDLRKQSISRLFHTCSVQSADYTSLNICTKEMSDKFVPSRVENILDDTSSQQSIVMRVKTLKSGLPWLVLSWNAEAARIGLTDPPPRAVMNALPNSFVDILKSTLNGAYITAIDMPLAFERTVVLSFSEALNSASKWQLILEVHGSRSNLVLVSLDTGAIRACAYQVSLSQTRPLQTGSTYVMPSLPGYLQRPLTRLALLKVKSGADGAGEKYVQSVFGRSSGVDIYHTLLFDFQGTSPSLIDALLQALGIASNTAVEDVSNEDRWRVLDALASWVDMMTDSADDCYGVDDEETLHVHVRPRIDKGTGRYNAVQFLPYTKGMDGVSLACEKSTDDRDDVKNMDVCCVMRDYYTRMQASKLFIALRSQCERRVAYHVNKLKKLNASLEQRLAQARGGAADEARHMADLVTAHIYAWDSRSPSLRCMDYTVNEEVVIHFEDACHTPVDYAKKLYHRAKKLERSASVLEKVLLEARLSLEAVLEIDSALDTMQELTHSEDIVTLRDILDDLNHFDEHQAISRTISVKARTDRLKETCADDVDYEDAAPLSPAEAKRLRKRIRERRVMHPKKRKGGSPSPNATKKEKSKKGKKHGGKLEGLLVVRRESQGASPPVVVGRSASQNDRISFTLARAHHHWFHVQGIPGSHCLLLLEPGQKATKEDTQFAADVAAYFSKARNSSSVPVGYCSPQFLKRTRGGTPGLVQVTQQDGMVYGRPDVGKSFISRDKLG